MGTQLPAAEKGGTAAPHFSAHVLWPNGWMDQDATWYDVDLGPDHVFDGDPAPPKKGTAPPTFRPMSIVAKRLDGPRCHLVRM